MLGLDLICYLVSAIFICLVLLTIIVVPVIIKQGKIEKESARDGEEGQPAHDPPTVRQRTCSSSRSLKIPADCPKNKFGYDFIVDLECPDGTTVRVAIPVDPNSPEGRGSRSRGEGARPVGLNLVCPGHYI